MSATPRWQYGTLNFGHIALPAADLSAPRGLGSSALDQIECLLRRNYDQRIDPSILKRPTGV